MQPTVATKIGNTLMITNDLPEKTGTAYGKKKTKQNF